MALHWIFLVIAIVAEVVATSSLKASEGFTKPLPTAIVIAGYAAAAYFLETAAKAADIQATGTAYKQLMSELEILKEEINKFYG